MMARYAQGTSVGADQSRLDLEKTLRRFGADAVMSAWDDTTRAQVVVFRLDGRQVRLDVPLPDPGEKQFTHTPSGRQKRTATAAAEEYQKEVRRRWRSLLLVVKAKLTAVQDGISTLEREFLADMIVEGDGRTVEQVIRPYLEQGGPLRLDGIGRRELER